MGSSSAASASLPVDVDEPSKQVCQLSERFTFIHLFPSDASVFQQTSSSYCPVCAYHSGSNASSSSTSMMGILRHFVLVYMSSARLGTEHGE